MTRKIFKSIFIVSSLTLIFSLVLILGVLYRHFGNQLSYELKNGAAYVAQGVKNEGLAYFDDFGGSDNRITWISSDGTVLYDSKADPKTMENHLDREEIVEAAESGTGESIRYSSTLSEKTVYYAIALKDGSFIRVSSTQYTVWALLIGMVQPILIILLFVVIVSLILASKMAKWIIKPINNINLDNPDVDEPYEELAPLLNKIIRQNKLIASQMDELRLKQEEFTMITENMNEGFLILDSKTEVLSYNSSALKLLGAESSVDKKNVLTLNRSESFRRAVELAIEGQHNEQSMQLNNRHYHIIANPVYSDIKVSGIVIIILDVTEKEQRDALRREFTSNVSHELKTPLTSISGIAEIMMNGIVKEKDVPQFAKNIYDEAGRLIALVDDIIRLSQLDENSIPAEKEYVDLYETAKTVAERLALPASAKKVSVELYGEHIKVKGIPGILEEMIYNLCDNAIKYNKENGKVRITAAEKEGKASLSVEDTGIGIPKEHIERVFERFYRVDKSHSRKIGGTGLGLSIVKHAAMYHGASINIDSKEGKGTTVTVQFP